MEKSDDHFEIDADHDEIDGDHDEIEKYVDHFEIHCFSHTCDRRIENV